MAFPGTERGRGTLPERNRAARGKTPLREARHRWIGTQVGHPRQGSQSTASSGQFLQSLLRWNPYRMGPTGAQVIAQRSAP